MNSSIYRFTLDMQKSQSQIAIPVKLYDTAREWHISLSDGNIPYKIDKGCIAILTISRPTTTQETNDFQVECPIRDNSIIVYSFDDQTAAVVGMHDCEVSIYGANNSVGKKIASACFTMVVNDMVLKQNSVSLDADDRYLITKMYEYEKERRTAENERKDAENEREKAETDRVEAEKTRVENEVRREEIVKDAATKQYVNDQINKPNPLYSGALKGNASGSNGVSIYDVSPTKHIVICKLSQYYPIFEPNTSPSWEAESAFGNETAGDYAFAQGYYTGVETGLTGHRLKIKIYGASSVMLYKDGSLSYLSDGAYFYAPDGEFAIAFNVLGIPNYSDFYFVVYDENRADEYFYPTSTFVEVTTPSGTKQYIPNEDGVVEVESESEMYFLEYNYGYQMDITYNRDLSAVIADIEKAILSLGGNV